MKIALSLALLASAEAFTASQSGRSSTELNQYRVTKWTPASGSKPFGGAAPSFSAPAPVVSEQGSASVAPSDGGMSYGGMPKATAAPKKGAYSVSKWSPRGNSNNGFDMPSVVSEGSAVSYGGMPKAAASSTGPKKNYLFTQWDPKKGASNVAVSTPQAAGPVSSSVATSGPKKNYSPVKWSPRSGANNVFTAPSEDLASSWASTNAATEELPHPQMAQPSYGSMPKASAAPAGKKNYAVSQWKP